MSLFVGNVSKNVSSRDLEKAFGKYGDCEVDLRVHPHTSLISQRSYAFIKFKEENDAEEAKAKLHNEDFGGLKINIEWSKKSGRYDSKEARKREYRKKIEFI